MHLPAALLNSALLVALPLAVPYGGLGLATAIVIGGGLTTPPLEAGLRALWPSVLPNPRLRSWPVGRRSFPFRARMRPPSRSRCPVRS